MNYLSLQLANTEEFIDGALTGNLGEVLIRQVSYHSVLCSPLAQFILHYVSGLPHSGQCTRIWHVDWPLVNITFSFSRCNNVLYVRGIEEEEEDGEMKD